MSWEQPKAMPVVWSARLPALEPRFCVVCWGAEGRAAVGAAAQGHEPRASAERQAIQQGAQAVSLQRRGPDAQGRE